LVLQDVDEQLIAPTVFQDIAFSPVNYSWKEDKIETEVKKFLNY
jgi:cobalt/nickel transport system ATP-binding protein